MTNEGWRCEVARDCNFESRSVKHSTSMRIHQTATITDSPLVPAGLAAVLETMQTPGKCLAFHSFFASSSSSENEWSSSTQLDPCAAVGCSRYNTSAQRHQQKMKQLCNRYSHTCRHSRVADRIRAATACGTHL